MGVVTKDEFRAGLGEFCRRFNLQAFHSEPMRLWFRDVSDAEVSGEELDYALARIGESETKIFPQGTNLGGMILAQVRQYRALKRQQAAAKEMWTPSQEQFDRRKYPGTDISYKAINSRMQEILGELPEAMPKKDRATEATRRAYAEFGLPCDL